MANSVVIPSFTTRVGNKIAGVKNLWVRAYDATTIVSEASSGFVKITPVNMSLTFKEDQQTGTGKAVDQTIAFTLIDDNSADMESLKDALLNDYFIQAIVETKAEGRKKVLGERFGLRATVNYAVGAKMGDLDGATIELKGVNDKFGREI